MNKPLTAEQSAFAAENHHVLMNYLKSKRLKADEYYDVLVFGYLEAVSTYLERPDLREQYTFEAIARQIMNFDLIDYYRSRYRKKNSYKYNVSLNSVVSYGEYDTSLEETIAAPGDVAGEAESKFLWDEISARLTRDQLNIIRMRIEGYNDMEIAKHNSIPFDEFNGFLSGILNSLADLLCLKQFRLITKKEIYRKNRAISKSTCFPNKKMIKNIYIKGEKIMQLTCNRDTLITAVTPALYAVSVKSTNQAVEGFHLSTGKDTLTITGYDLHKGVRIVLSDVKVSSGGELVVNAQKFAQIIKNLPDGEVEISADDKNMLTITAGKSIYDISVLNAETYPQIPDFVSEKAFRIKQSVLKQMISETLFAVAVNNSRQTLNGALFEIENDVIKIIGIDGFRLAFRKENGQIVAKGTSAESLSMKFIVPGKSLSDLQKILRDNDESIDIELSKKQIVVHNGNIMFFSRLIDGEFLDYKKTIPSTPTTKVVVDRKQLIGGIERASVIMDQNTNPLRMNFVKETGSSSVQISAATTIGKANDSCVIDIDGPDIEIGFNHKFLLETFKTIRDDKVTLKLEGPLRSLVVSSVEECDESEPKYLYMVLPLRLRSA